MIDDRKNGEIRHYIPTLENHAAVRRALKDCFTHAGFSVDSSLQRDPYDVVGRIQFSDSAGFPTFNSPMRRLDATAAFVGREDQPQGMDGTPTVFITLSTFENWKTDDHGRVTWGSWMSWRTNEADHQKFAALLDACRASLPKPPADAPPPP